MIKAKYYDGQTSNSHDAQIELWKSRIYIITSAGNHEWAYEKCYVIAKANRHADGRIGFDDSPNAQLVFEDRAMFKEVAAKLPLRKAQPLYKSAIYYAASIGLLLFAIFYMVPALAPALGNKMPSAWELRLGNFVQNSFTSKFQTCKSPTGQAALDKIIKALGQNANSKYKFTAIVLKEDKMNAFTAPGGHIMILSGLIDKSDNESQLEGVLAHEMGHAVKRHGVDGLIRTLLTTFVIDMITGGGGSTVYLGSQALEMNYTRDAESEADRFALTLLDKTNINPQGLYDFFGKVQKEEQQGAGKYTKDYDLSFFSTHPATMQRMTMVQNALDPARKYNDLLSLQEWKALKAMCQ